MFQLISKQCWWQTGIQKLNDHGERLELYKNISYVCISSVREFSMYGTWWIFSFYTTHKLTPTDFILVDAVYHDLHDILKRQTMMWVCWCFALSISPASWRRSHMLLNCLWLDAMTAYYSLQWACNDKLNLKHDGKIQIRLIRAMRHLCNCWLIWIQTWWTTHYKRLIGFLH